MSSELTSVTVRIYGWDYTLKVDPSEVERAKALAEYLDKRMQLIAKKSGTADTLKIAIRSAITIIDDLFATQAKLENLQQSSQQASQPQITPEWEEKLHELSNRIEKELQTL